MQKGSKSLGSASLVQKRMQLEKNRKKMEIQVSTREEEGLRKKVECAERSVQ